MNELSLFLAAVLIGLLGSGHCLVMCGGIAAARGVKAVKSRSLVTQSAMTQIPVQNIPSPEGAYHRLTAGQTPSGKGLLLADLMLFNSGRLISYALIGFIMGSIGAVIALDKDLLQILRITAGLLLIAMGLYVSQWWMGLVRIERLGQGTWKRISSRLRHKEKEARTSPFLLGTLWGTLPCGLVYSTLAWAMTSHSGQSAAIIMLGFGIGTLPSMLGAGMFSFYLRRFFSHVAVKRLAGVLLIAFGFWTMPWGSLVH